MSRRYSCNEVNHGQQANKSAAKICICYHWTPSSNHQSIINSNLIVPDGKNVKHRTDIGWFGKGVYMSPDYRYAQSYGDNYCCGDVKPKVFVCLSLPGRQFGATCLCSCGRSLKHGYDSHFSASLFCFFCMYNKEWVFFDSSQLLPCCLVTIEDIHKANAIAQIIIDVIQTL